MEIILGIIVIILLLISGGLFYLYTKKSANPVEDDKFKTLTDELKDIRKEMNQSIKDSLNFVQTEASRSGKMIAGITEKLTKLDETNKQVVSFTDQLQNLQDILKNPKQRGILGEYYLETVLKNVLPPGNYKMQYAFRNGEIVDAAVFVKDKIIPVDSKFSLENYNRLAEARDPSEKERLEKLFINDLKTRIQETAKYIRPGERTMDFAFMFIPHEAIYYDLLVSKVGLVTDDAENLIQRAASKYKVLIVSPTSFLAYLQTVLQGLKALQIEETAKDIVKRVDDLGKHLKSYEEYHQKLGNAIGTTVNHYIASGKEFKKIDKDILKVTGSSIGFDPLALEKPVYEE